MAGRVTASAAQSRAPWVKREHAYSPRHSLLSNQCTRKYSDVTSTTCTLFLELETYLKKASKKARSAPPPPSSLHSMSTLASSAAGMRRPPCWGSGDEGTGICSRELAAQVQQMQLAHR